MATSYTIDLPPALRTAVQPSPSDPRRVVLMTCGIAGAGKSTLCRTVVAEYPSFTRLSVDAYIWDKYGAYEKDYPAVNYSVYLDEGEAAVHQRLREILAAGEEDIVLDLACAFRETRDGYRKIIEDGGGRVVLVYLQCDKDTLWRRIQARARGTKDANSSLDISVERFNMYLGCFEPPTDEGQIMIDRSEQVDVAEAAGADP